jgi:predicted RND superfamily exporter protein
MKSRWPLITLLLASLLAIPLALQVEVDPGTRGWVDAHGPAATALQVVEDRFGRQDGFVIVLFAPDVLAPDAVAWQRAMATGLASLAGVVGVDALPTAQDVVVDDLGPAPAPLLDQPRAQILTHPIYQGLLLSGNGTAAAIFARLDPGVDDRGSIALETRIRNLLADHPVPAGMEAVLGGLPVQQHAIARAVARDQAVTVPLILLLLALVLVVTVPSWRLVLATLAGVGSALGWTFAGLFLAGRQLDALLGLLPPLVLGIGVATAIHLLRGLALAAVAGHPRPRRAALARLGFPLALATLTALAGVGGLWLGAVPAVRTFAPWAMVAVVAGTLLPLSWILVVVPWVPAGDWTRIAAGTWGDRFGLRLARLARAAAQRPRLIMAVAGGLASLAAFSCLHLHADADFIHALPAGDPARMAQERIDRDLTGTLGLDVLIDAGHAPTTAEMDALRALGERARREASVAHAMSLADVIGLVQARGDHRPAQAILEDLRLGAKPLLALFIGPGLGAGGPHTLRLMCRQRDGSVSEAAAAARRIQADANLTFPGAIVVVASASLLLDETTAHLLPATALSLTVSKIAVVLLLLLFLRRWRPALIALILVALPLLLTYAVIPALGWPLDVGVSMIACIALGIIMNDTVHLVHALHHQGRDAAYRDVGPAVALAGIVLALSFSACDLGGFSYTRRFGVLLALAFVSGLLVNLLLAPALARILSPSVESPP